MKNRRKEWRDGKKGLLSEVRALGKKSIFRRNRWLVSMQPLSYTSKNRNRKSRKQDRPRNSEIGK